MTGDRHQLRAGHDDSSDHGREVEASRICGCFYCCETFPPGEIEHWLEEGRGTALCPRCAIDAVIGSASGFPVAEPGFLRAMHAYWFADR